MQCTKAIYPHSKYNYVTCTRLVEKFSDGDNSGIPATVNSTGSSSSGISCSCTGDASGNDAFSLSCKCTRVGSDSSTISGATTGTDTSTTTGTGTGTDTGATTGTDTGATTGTGITTSAPKEGFADLMTNPSQETIVAAAKDIANVAQAAVSTEVPMAAKAAVIAGVSDLAEQVKQEHECNKTTLHVTIGILVTIVIGLVAYIVYQQMKNKQQ